MNADPKWYALAALMLILLVILAPRALNLRAHSDQEMRDICLEIYDECIEMGGRNATSEEWLAFEAEAVPKLRAVAEEIERLPSDSSLDAWRLYQSAMHDIPAIIQDRKITNQGSRIEDALAIAPSSYELSYSSEKAATDKGGTMQRDWDPLVACLLLFDAAVLAGGIIYWRRGRSRSARKRPLPAQMP